MSRIKFVLLCTALLSMASVSKGQWQSEFSYAVGFPSGQFQDFVQGANWVNWQFQARKEVNPRYEIGGAIGWNYFAHDFGRITIPGDGFAVTGNITNFTNILTVLLVNQYNLATQGDARPFVRLGAGTGYQNQQTNIGIYRLSDDAWQFVLNPEAGVNIPLNWHTSLMLAASYTFMPEAGQVRQTAFWNLKIGLTWLRF